MVTVKAFLQSSLEIVHSWQILDEEELKIDFFAQFQFDLLLGYLLGYGYFTTYVDNNYDSILSFWALNSFVQLLLALAIGLLFSAAAVASYWKHDNWSEHPFVDKLKVYCTSGRTWRDVVADINTEFRR